MQLAVVEAARNLAGIKDASTTEFGPTDTPLVGLMSEWTKGNELVIRDASTDMGDWESEVEDSIPADGETTTIERLLADLPVSGPRIFFRVELSE